MLFQYYISDCNDLSATVNKSKYFVWSTYSNIPFSWPSYNVSFSSQTSYHRVLQYRLSPAANLSAVFWTPAPRRSCNKLPTFRRNLFRISSQLKSTSMKKKITVTLSTWCSTHEALQGTDRRENRESAKSDAVITMSQVLTPCQDCR